MGEQNFIDNIVHRFLGDDGTFPNNGRLPLLIYQDTLTLPGRNPARAIEQLIESHNWGSSWRNGIFSHHHYHSSAHEALGVYSGKAQVQLGGPEGPQFSVQRGDVIVIPAGVAHKNLGCRPDFRVVGAYPAGQSWDLNVGKAGERPQADRNMANVPLPETDPVFGETRPLVRLWRK